MEVKFEHSEHDDDIGIMSQFHYSALTVHLLQKMQQSCEVVETWVREEQQTDLIEEI